MQDPRGFLRRLFDAALAAADPQHCLPPHLPAPPRGRTVVVGAGKASARMAQVLEAHWPGPLQGLVVTRYGHGAECTRIRIVEAAHPTPDGAGRAAAQEILDLATGLGADDLLICLISGGGSSLMSLPAPGIDLADKQSINRALLASGAPISDINSVRKQLSAIKGGRLALAARPARVHGLLISDVPGDDPGLIASGPTVADSGTRAEARTILARHNITVPAAVARHLAMAEDVAEAADADGAFDHVSNSLITTPMRALEAAAETARKVGIIPLILGDGLEGNARDLAPFMADIVRSVHKHGRPVAPPAVLLSGGEVTVQVRGSGQGGPNAEFALALALALDGMAGVFALSCDTDGIDGAAEVAGALITPDSLHRARARGLDAGAALADNDGHGFFAALGDQIITGPTRTNVNDFRALLIL